jgi:hypothetical protein
MVGLRARRCKPLIEFCVQGGGYRGGGGEREAGVTGRGARLPNRQSASAAADGPVRGSSRGVATGFGAARVGEGADARLPTATRRARAGIAGASRAAGIAVVGAAEERRLRLRAERACEGVRQTVVGEARRTRSELMPGRAIRLLTVRVGAVGRGRKVARGLCDRLAVVRSDVG